MAEANIERGVVRVLRVPGTRKNSVRYNTECGYIFYKKDLRLVLHSLIVYLSFNQLTYYVHHLRGDTLRLECVNRKRENGGCPCKIYFTHDVYTQTGLHNHGPMLDEQRRAAVVHECVTIAETPQQGRQGPKRILEQARRNHPEAIIALNPALERRIQRAKRSAQPPTPNSVEDIVQSMETHPEFKYEKTLMLISTFSF